MTKNRLVKRDRIDKLLDTYLYHERRGEDPYLSPLQRKNEKRIARVITDCLFELGLGDEWCSFVNKNG